MSKIVGNTLKFSPALFSAAILVANTALAGENSTRFFSENKTTDANALNASVPGVAALASGQMNLAPSSESVLAQIPSVDNETSGNAQPETNSVLDQVNQYAEQGSTLEQVTSVSQLRDVQPTDWAFQALQSLVERYGCIEGYPDRTYRGNRAMTRYEFAAGLNACLEQIVKLIPGNNNNNEGGVTQEDLASIRRLQEEFRTELTSLRGRVDSLEARTRRLEAQQFSTTTKLRGEAVFALSGVAGEGRAVASGLTSSGLDVEENIIFADRVRLNLDSSFTGKDRLRTRLQARNMTPFGSSVTGTNMTRLSLDGNDNNNVTIQRLEYSFPLTSHTKVFLEAAGGEFNDNMYTFNPALESSTQGSISRFGRFNPIYRLAAEGTGVTITHDFSNKFGLAIGYQVPPNRANNPSDNFGLFDGSYAAIAQLAFRPSKSFNAGFTYVHSYLSGANGDVSVSGGTGSSFANAPFGSAIATSSDHFSLEASFRLSPRFIISGWGGYTKSQQETGGNANADIWNYAVTLGLPDFGKKGNLLGFVAGQPPKVTSNDIAANEDSDTSYHLEAFYRIQVSDNISITPGGFVILNPEHNNDNNAIYVGTIRTTFTF